MATGVKYKKASHRKFVCDMEAAGIKWQHYGGRNYYSGPAAITGEGQNTQDIMSATQVKLQFDNMGKGYVYYPR